MAGVAIAVVMVAEIADVAVMTVDVAATVEMVVVTGEIAAVTVVVTGAGMIAHPEDSDQQRRQIQPLPIYILPGNDVPALF